MAELTKEQIEAIQNYHKEIETIEIFTEAVRKTPGQYLSDIGTVGWMSAIREIIQNSTDEMNREISPCNKVWVEYFEGINRLIVSDNGRGLDPADMIRVYTSQHTSTNYKKQRGVYVSGLHGLGSKCTNAVSIRFNVKSYRLGKGYEIEFKEGKPLKKYANGPLEIPNKGNKQGLVVDCEPDLKIMKEINLTCQEILLFLETMVPLLNHGACVEFIGHLINGTVIRKNIVNEFGIQTYLMRQTEKPLIKPIVYSVDTGEMRVDVAISYEANLNAQSNIITFANMTPVKTQYSTPSQGFFQGLCQFFRNHMNKVYLANSKKKIEVISNDIVVGLIGAISAYHMDIMFNSQAKDICKNPEFVDFVKEVTINALKEWSKNNPDDLQKLCEFFKDVATARLKADKEKITISKKYKTTEFWNLPEGFKKAERKDHLELFIVEGLSAAAPCAEGRDPLYQAVFPIRGKMLNAFSTPKARFLENKEVQGIISILNCGIGKNCDANACHYDKIIILNDADSDRMLSLKGVNPFEKLIIAGKF